LAEIKGIALGRLSMSIEELEMMEIGALFLKLFYHNQKEREDRQFYGNIMRLQTMLLMNMQLESKSRIKHPEQLWKFDWDEESMGEVEELTDQEKQERFELLREVAKKHLNGKL
jgi:hypothetical protein